MQNYYQSQWVIATDEYLMHHGTKGQKWGVRKYQNSDGSLTAEGKRRYGVGEGLKKIKDYMTTRDEQGKLHLSKEGKRIAVGAGLGAAAIGAGVGTVALAKAGAFKGLKGNLAKNKQRMAGMSNDELKSYMDSNLNRAVRAITGRTDAGQKITGITSSQRAQGGVRGAARHIMASKEYGARKVGDVLKNMAGMTTKMADQAASGEVQKDVNEILRNNLKGYGSKMLAIGAVASVGLTAYNAKQKVNEEDPTGEKGRYMYPNPNKKK